MNGINRLKYSDATSALRNVGKTLGSRDAESIPATKSQYATVREALGTFAKSLAGDLSPAREKVGGVVNDNKVIKEKKADITSKMEKATTGVNALRTQLASKGWIFDISVISNFKKGIAENIGGMMKSKTCRNILKSVLMTNTRIVPDDIVKKTDNKPQKAAWAENITHWGLTLRDGKEGNSLRVTRKNLEMIEGKEKALTEELSGSGGRDPEIVRSELKLCQILIEAYTPRLAMKANYHALFKKGAELGAEVLSSLQREHFDSPETLIGGVITAIGDNPALKSHFEEMITDAENPLRKVVVAAGGENAILGLKLAISDDGLAIAKTLLSVGNMEMVSSFMQDPVTTILNNRELLGKAAGEVCDQLVRMLDKTDLADAMMQLSGGKLQQVDIDFLKSMLPDTKAFVAELATSGSQANGPSEGPSELALMASKMLSHVATRCDIELESHHTGSRLAVAATFSNLMSMMDTSMAVFTAHTVGTPDGTELTLEEPPEAAAQKGTSERTWGEWFTETAVDVTAYTLGYEAAQTVDSAAASLGNVVGTIQSTLVGGINYAADRVAAAAQYVHDGVTDAVVEKVSNQGAAMIDKEIDDALGGIKAPKGPKVELALNQEKLNEFMAQSVGMLSHFLAENPQVIDQLGASSLAVLGSVADIMQNPTMDSGEKSVTLSAALRDNLGQIGQALIATGGEAAGKVGNTLINAGALLGSEVVQRSLEKSQLFTAETAQRAMTYVSDKMGSAGELAVTQYEEKHYAPKLAARDGAKTPTIQVSKTVAAVLRAEQSLDNGTVGGMMGSLMSWIGADGVRATVHLAGQLVI